ncbi:M24 family metallopeptidase [Enterococcus alcedinis]|uniref:Peptidase M24 domain-containing protein n=1 Tax=Enterococcus alcedinis TaxID=1274384 RepID=A0A917N576_9ENTE|nr:Xaa-Pro peptidase family protein [Enterococcus alcedinis]MBP2102997.1 Xaa-Pro aminopeptidase [Enterococcus alcedinis]GGI66530.1 hypothetical protein GCM10011482_21840 [Enterococcus alcedinis]
MDEKIKQMQQVMTQTKIDVLILHYPEELVMAFDYFPFWGRSFAFVFRNQAPILFIPENEPDISLIQGNLNEQVKVISVDDFETLATYKRRQKLEVLTIGTSLLPKNASLPANGAEQGGMPYEWWQQLLDLPNVTVRDESPLIQSFSKHKSKTAIEKIRSAHKIAEVGLQTFYEMLHSNVTEYEVALAIETRIKQQAMASGCRFVLCYPQIQAGRNSLESGTFNRTTTKMLETSELVLLELAVCIDGYWLDLTRTGVVGTANHQQLWHYQQVEKAQLAAIRAMKPGVAFSHLQAIAKEALQSENLAVFFTHGLGHSVGYQYHDPALAINEFSQQVLEPGMILTIEPGIYGAEIEGGIRIEDNLLVTESGVEWLSSSITGLTGERRTHLEFGGK